MNDKDCRLPPEPSSQRDSSSSQRQSSLKPRKFKPTIPQKKKKAVEGQLSLKTEPAEDEAFKDLLQAAQEPANWERSSGKACAKDSQRPPAQVAFGGNATGLASGGLSRHTAGRPSSSAAQAWAGGSQYSSKQKEGQPSSSGRLVKANGRAVTDQVDETHLLHAAERDLGDQAVEDALDFESYHPTVLPLRPPGSRPVDPSCSEIGQVSWELDAEEDEVNVAESLKLLNLEDSDPQESILLQLPTSLPAPAKEIKQEPTDGRRKSEPPPEHHAALSLHELPPGKLGKLLVFESGKVKLQLGGVLMDVSLGTQCQCLQHVVALNTDAKSAMLMGSIAHRAVVTPDMEQLLGNSGIPDWPRAPRAELKEDGAEQERAYSVFEEDTEMKDLDGKLKSEKRARYHILREDSDEDKDSL